MKRLFCLIGRHEWEHRSEHGEEFSVCKVCGKEGAGGGSGNGDAVRDHVWDRVGGG